MEGERAESFAQMESWMEDVDTCPEAKSRRWQRDGIYDSSVTGRARLARSTSQHHNHVIGRRRIHDDDTHKDTKIYNKLTTSAIIIFIHPSTQSCTHSLKSTINIISNRILQKSTLSQNHQSNTSFHSSFNHKNSPAANPGKWQSRTGNQATSWVHCFR